MDILPAIDLIGGKCVRLVQGEYDKQINYEDDPVKQAKAFVKSGAEWLHVIDLDGARLGKPSNIEAIKNIAEHTSLKIEVGGGIRDEESIKLLLDLGIERLIIGTKAINEFAWFRGMVSKFPHRLVLGLDARGSKVSTHGWTQDASKSLIEFAQDAANLDIAAIIYTDITKDGMLDGPNVERTRELVESVDVPIVAAGGVTTVDDITRLGEVGVSGAVIGRSLYEGGITLEAALEAAG